MRERDLKGHIKAPSESGAPAEEPAKVEQTGPDDLERDNQLKSAVDILKSWEIFKKTLPTR